MIDLLVFIPACFALNLAFGPNNLLSLTHGAERGVTFALPAAMARLAAFVPMITASALGLGVLMSTSALLFGVVKVAGALYLLWLGVKLLRTHPTVDAQGQGHVPASLHQAARREGLAAVSNPKAILIFAAFFPQFVDTQAYWTSYATLGALFLGLEACAITIYALAGRFAARFASRRMHWFQRASGGGMVLFGLLLLASRQTGQA